MKKRQPKTGANQSSKDIVARVKENDGQIIKKIESGSINLHSKFSF